MIRISKPDFPIGKLLATPAAMEALQAADVNIIDLVERHQQSENAGALFQVASQFNLLEMVSPAVTPDDGIGICENDRTPGPACAIASGSRAKSCFAGSCLTVLLQRQNQKSVLARSRTWSMTIVKSRAIRHTHEPKNPSLSGNSFDHWKLRFFKGPTTGFVPA